MELQRGVKIGLNSLVTFMLMPLIGWWVGGGFLGSSQITDNISSVLSDPARTGYLLATVGRAALIGRLASILVQQKNKVRPFSGSIHWRNIAMETILVLSPFCDHRAILVLGDSPIPRWCGVILFVLGGGLQLWASLLHARVAARFNAGPNDTLLMVEGPFRRLRYPDYLGLLILSLGVALVFRSWIGLGAAVFMLNFTIMRINEEEKTARQKFGVQWTLYSRKSWRLVPYIY